MKKGNLIYRGKAKSLYEIDQSEQLIMEFRDDISAFNAEKLANLSNKGKVNNYFNAYIMEKLAESGIKSHFIKVLDAENSLVKRLSMIPVECVVRNIAAGSICKRLGIKEGLELNPATFEFFYKDDKLGDPLINDSHIISFQWATTEEIAEMKKLTLQINTILTKLFADAGILLIDYKLEFGRYNGEVLLGDEFTPDGCRLWDVDTREKLDKDRFRSDLGNVIESYKIVADRLGVTIP